MYEVSKDVWCLVAMRADGDGWVVDCCPRMAREVELRSPHIEDLFNHEGVEDFPVGPGLHVWEGDVTTQGDDNEFDVSFAGAWRRASAAEVIAFVQGKVRS